MTKTKQPNEKDGEFQEFYKLSREDVLRLLGSSARGISQEEAKTRLVRVGKNILDERKEKIESGNAKFISLEELKASRKS